MNRRHHHRQGRRLHTTVLVLHVAFKAAAFAVYEFGGVVAGMGYVATFIAVTLLLRQVLLELNWTRIKNSGSS